MTVTRLFMRPCPWKGMNSRASSSGYVDARHGRCKHMSISALTPRRSAGDLTSSRGDLITPRLKLRSLTSVTRQVQPVKALSPWGHAIAGGRRPLPRTVSAKSSMFANNSVTTNYKSSVGVLLAKTKYQTIPLCRNYSCLSLFRN